MSEYMPKVGEDCEAKFVTASKWVRLKTVFVGSEIIVGISDGVEHPYSTDTYKFRPLKTQADIEREEAISKIESLIEACYEADDIAKAIYEAGYHNGPKTGEKVDAASLLSEYMNCPHTDWEGFLAGFNIYKKVK